MENSNYTPPQRQFKSLTIGDGLITLLIEAIPIVGFIMLFVWAFGGDTHPSKKTWAEATLIFMAIIAGLIMILFIGVFIMSMSEGMNYDYST